MNYEDFINRFEYNPDQDMLGEGGFGIVYKAYDNWRHETVALKVVRFRAELEQFSLLNEFELAKNLQHPNIAYYSECYRISFPQHGMHEVAIMKYYEAGHLGQLLKKNILTPVQKHRLIEGILAGINYLHSRRPVIIHRDLKPSNILIFEKDSILIPLITDFGISRKAKDLDVSHVTVTTLVGSVNFAAPEQWEGAELRPTADLWSLGVLMSYVCLDGRLPFRSEGINFNTESGQMEYRRRLLALDWSPIVNQIPEPYLGLIRQCLVIDPKQRIQSVKELVLPPFIHSGTSSSQASGVATDSGIPKTEPFPSLQKAELPVPKHEKGSGNFKNKPAFRVPENEETGTLNPDSNFENSKSPLESDQTGVFSNPMDMLSLGVIPFPESKNKEAPEFPSPIKVNKRRWGILALSVVGVAIFGIGIWYFVNTDKATVSQTQILAPLPEKPTNLKVEKNEVYVEGGTFNMGNENGADNEKPVHSVTVSGFWMAKTEMTVKQYRQFCKETARNMPDSPPWGWKDDLPIVNVNWEDAKSYCQWLSKKTSRSYRLPTEAEWEYAARGGKLSKGYMYAGSNRLDEVGWFSDNTQEKGPKEISLKKANELGLYDMSGNVWEWCADDYALYREKSENNSQSILKPSGQRVLRGGAWYYAPEFMGVSTRLNVPPLYKSYGVGFRYVRVEK